METLVKPNTIDCFNVFFYRWRFGLLPKAIRDYHRMFNSDAWVDHVALQLGNTIYETTKYTTVKCDAEQAFESYMTNPALVGVYASDITSIPIERRYQAQLYLEELVQSERKVEGRKCLKYLREFVAAGRPTLEQCDLSFNLPEATMRRERGTVLFNLPFTCGTMASNVMNFLHDFEPLADGHLPTSVFSGTIGLVHTGFGSLYEPV